MVLVHSSPANATFLTAEIEYLAASYTVFAFDTPGFGLSEALPLETMLVADLADALDETLRAISMPPCPMFGTHSGAAIVLELGVRHPERVTGLVLDGVPAFTDAECAAFFGDYFRKIPVTDLGGQYAAVWTRFRDQSIWFPWSTRAPEQLNAYDLGAPESTHVWASMYFQAADTYTPAYRATSHYGARAQAAAAALQQPAIYTATDTDMLFPHLARLPPLKPGQELRHIGRSQAAKRALMSEGFARFGSPHAAPADRDAIVSSAHIARQFVEIARGGQIHLRSAGSRDLPAVLLLHDAPGSAAALESLMLALADRYFVLAPDLSGCGESDRLPPDGASIADYAKSVVELLVAVDIPLAHIFALGFGTSVAIALSQQAPERVARVALCGVLLPEQNERAGLAARYAPPIPIERDGGHWYRTWLMLRDSLIWWPWFDRRRDTQRRVPADFGADHLHRWTVDVMGSREGYGDIIHAAFADNAADSLAALCESGIRPTVFLGGHATPFTAYDDRLTSLLAGSKTLPMPGATATLANHLAAAFTEGPHS